MDFIELRQLTFIGLLCPTETKNGVRYRNIWQALLSDSQRRRQGDPERYSQRDRVHDTDTGGEPDWEAPAIKRLHLGGIFLPSIWPTTRRPVTISPITTPPGLLRVMSKFLLKKKINPYLDLIEHRMYSFVHFILFWLHIFMSACNWDQLRFTIENESL